MYYKKQILFFLLSSLIITGLTCSKKQEPRNISHSTHQTNHSHLNEIDYYTCSMHPSVRADKPGKCPICHMDLIPIYKSDRDNIVVDEKKVELLGIKSEPVQRRLLIKTIQLPGRVAEDNELYLAQQEYLTSYKNLLNLDVSATKGQRERLHQILLSSILRLKLLGFSDKAIAQLNNKNGPEQNLIYPGKKVWVVADVYEYDLGIIKPGLAVEATSTTYPGESFHGIIKAIEPVLNPETRSAMARIELINPQDKLKLEMFLSLKIKINLGQYLSIPKQAFIDTGLRKVVFLDHGHGRYKINQIETGQDTDDYVQVVKGLKENERVVVNGNFMLDSQVNLTGNSSLLFGSSEEVKNDKKPVHQH